MTNDLPLIIGHRGASAVAPENTLAAFERAMKDGADGVEFDVRLSRDDVPVVIHDATLARTGLTDSLVSELTVAELQKIDVGSWFAGRSDRRRPSSRESYSGQTLPSLAQVFELFASNKGLLYVEMKCRPEEGAALAGQVVKVIREARISDRVVVESFDLSAIAEVKRLDAGVRTSALFEPKVLHPAAILRRLKMVDLVRRHLADELALHHTLAAPRVVDTAQQYGLEIVVWTVDEVAWIDRARSLGLKALITNDPAMMLHYRNGA